MAKRKRQRETRSSPYRFSQIQGDEAMARQLHNAEVAADRQGDIEAQHQQVLANEVEDAFQARMENWDPTVARRRPPLGVGRRNEARAAAWAERRAAAAVAQAERVAAAAAARAERAAAAATARAEQAAAAAAAAAVEQAAAAAPVVQGWAYQGYAYQGGYDSDGYANDSDDGCEAGMCNDGSCCFCSDDCHGV